VDAKLAKAAAETLELADLYEKVIMMMSSLL